MKRGDQIVLFVLESSEGRGAELCVSRVVVQVNVWLPGSSAWSLLFSFVRACHKTVTDNSLYTDLADSYALAVERRVKDRWARPAAAGTGASWGWKRIKLVGAAKT
jgi:hypothetical protein